MSKQVADQADGLRRLLAPAPTRVIAVASMARGAGATTTAMNIAAALVLQGKIVLLLDQHAALAGSVCAQWAIDALGTWTDVAQHRLRCAGAAVASGSGVHVLPAPPDPAVATSDPREFYQGGAILIDAAIDDEGRLLPLAQMADELVLVLQPTPSAVTAAYAGIKRLHYAHALKQARLVFNGVRDADSAQQMLTNLVNTGSRHLAVSLQDGGLVRADPHQADARRLYQTVVEAYGTSPAAVDFRRIADELWRSPWRSKVLRSRAAEQGHRIVDGAIDAAHAASHPAAAFQGSSF